MRVLDRAAPRGVAWVSVVAAFVTAGAAAAATPNLLLVVADDVGVDHVAAYGEGAALVPTPTLDLLAASGVLFRNTWSNPTCSPTRATMMTGRYGFRTGLGSIIGAGGYSLPGAEFTVPEVLDLVPSLGYAHAAIGKWHLGKFGDVTAPNAAGFSHYRGAITNVPSGDRPESYRRYTEVTNGVAADVTGYATTREVDHALEWIGAQTAPWFCAVFFHTPHTPFHAPPPDLHDRLLPPGRPIEDPLPFHHAALQAMDREIARLLAGLGSAAAETVVVFVADNGTDGPVSVAPFSPEHAKATVFEGGVNVPLIVSGPGIVQPGREVAALVNTTDLYATLLELAGVDLGVALPPGWKHDSVSLVPYLVNPAQAPLRTHAFAEAFKPNGFAPTAADRVIRDDRYKLRRIGIAPASHELYDLVADPFEQVDLLAGGAAALGPSELQAYQSLRAALDALLGS